MEYLRIRLERIARAWAYAVQGWNSPDWDYVHLYSDIIFKLKRMEISMLGGMHVDNKRTAHEIKIARLALERLNADNYVELLRGWVRGEDLKKFSEKALRRDFDYEEKMKEQDLFLFASQFIKHSRSWWD